MRQSSRYIIPFAVGFAVCFALFRFGLLAQDGVTRVQMTPDLRGPSKAMPLADTPITKAVMKMEPSVVNIDTVSIIQPRESRIERLFRETLGGPPPQPIERPGAASGVIITKEGHILTNYHVTNAVSRFMVTLMDGRKYPAKLIGEDSASELAVLKIDAPNLIPASFGDSDVLRPGDWAIAIGNPLSLQSSVTLGIISSTARENVYIGGKTLERVIQTDAPINPGNSGGALANVNGELIGINTAIVTGGSSGNIGIGFAIPINSARTVAADLIQFRKVRRAWLGVFTEEASRYIEGKTGLIVFNVVSGSPADKAGLSQYDIIVRINDQTIGNAIDFSKAMRNRKIGESISLEVEREGKVVHLRAILAENPS